MKPSDWPANWTVRPASFDDVDLAVDMFNARSRKFYGENQSTVDDMLGWWKSPRFDLARDTCVVLDETGRMIAWSHAVDPGEPYLSLGCAVITDPDFADRDDLWDGLYAWALTHTSRHIEKAPEGARVFAVESAMDEDEARRSAVERAGFEMVRVQNTMRIDLDETPPEPEWSEGIDVRAAIVEEELERIVAASREAFRDHWGFVEEPLEQALDDWKSWLSSLGDRRDPSLWFVAHEGDEIAGLGFFSTEIAGDRTRSYVETLSVRPAYRKRGIALALLHHSFGELHRRGKTAVELDMDSENLTGAPRLYERAGMRVIRRTINYEKVLRDGQDLTTRKLAA